METESVGADILRNLRGQREQIEHTRDTVCPLSASTCGQGGVMRDRRRKHIKGLSGLRGARQEEGCNEGWGSRTKLGVV